MFTAQCKACVLTLSFLLLSACGAESPQLNAAADNTGGETGGGGENGGSGGGSGGGADGGSEEPDSQAPVARNDTYSLNMNSPNNRLAVLLNDADANDAGTDTSAQLKVLSVTSPIAGGHVYINEDASQIVYEPPINFTGNDNFSYVVQDPAGNESTAVVSITLNALVPPNPAGLGPRPCITERVARRIEGRPYCFDVLIPNGFDGHTIAATVFVPELDPGETAPVLLHAHGFGEARFASLENPNSFMLNRVTAQALLELWHEGYWVVSYDQRGFNPQLLWGPATPGSNDPCLPPANESGCINVMSPEHEARDMTVVVDWISANLREGFNPLNPAQTPAATAAALYTEDAADDPVLGTTGLSYGGGFQTMGTSVEKALSGFSKVNAMVPVTTWYDLRYSLVPNDVVKSAWLEFLGLATNLGGTLPLGAFFAGAATEAFVNDDISQDTFDGLYQRSVRSYCDGVGDDNINGTVAFGSGTAAGPDAFFIQGQRDLLFNFNESYDLAQCYAAANPNADVRLLVETDGHVLATVQPPSHKGIAEVIYIDETVFCDGERLSTAGMITSFFREKLGALDNPRGEVTADAVPVVCITQYEEEAAPVSGVTFNSLGEVPIGGTEFTLDGNAATPAAEPVTFTVQLNPVTVVNAQPIQQLSLLTATSEHVLAGIPLLDINITATGTPSIDLGLGITLIDPPRFFVGVGIQRAGGGLEIIADQVTPISGPPPALPATTSNYRFPRTDENGIEHGEGIGRIAGVSATLNVGDELQLLIFDQHPLFHLHGTLTGAYAISVTGTVSMPLLPTVNTVVN